MSVHVYSVPCVSTAHVEQATMQALTDAIKFGTRIGAEYPEGVWLYVPAKYEFDLDPPELQALCKWADSKGYSWVRLDADGDKVDELQEFSW